jgi:hypothetical protein
VTGKKPSPLEKEKEISPEKKEEEEHGQKDLFGKLACLLFFIIKILLLLSSPQWTLGSILQNKKENFLLHQKAEFNVSKISGMKKSLQNGTK